MVGKLDFNGQPMLVKECGHPRPRMLVLVDHLECQAYLRLQIFGMNGFLNTAKDFLLDEEKWIHSTRKNLMVPFQLDLPSDKTSTWAHHLPPKHEQKLPSLARSRLTYVQQ